MLENRPRLKAVLWPLRILARVYISFKYSDSRRNRRIFAHDAKRFLRYSGAYQSQTREALLAQIIIHYHIVEKGLTMPNRRYGFGKDNIITLSRMIDEFVFKFGSDDSQLRHAIGVVKEYKQLHDSAGFDLSTLPETNRAIEHIASAYPEIFPARQLHFAFDEFYANNKADFAEFAKSRHTLRHYSNAELPESTIREAMEIAMTTPSACNRQHARVYCVIDKAKYKRILELQAGNRGFGHLADKLVIVAADLEDVCGDVERTDAFIDGGMFLMNFCYALHYKKVAHCVLNWSKSPAVDEALHKFLGIPSNEVIIAILSCGIAPNEFDVAASPRKDLNTMYKVV